LRSGIGTGDEIHLRQVGLPLSALLGNRHSDGLVSVACVLSVVLVPEILSFSKGPHASRSRPFFVVVDGI
jgi:hypothetical protein